MTHIYSWLPDTRIRMAHTFTFVQNHPIKKLNAPSTFRTFYARWHVLSISRVLKRKSDTLKAWGRQLVRGLKDKAPSVNLLNLGEKAQGFHCLKYKSCKMQVSAPTAEKREGGVWMQRSSGNCPTVPAVSVLLWSLGAPLSQPALVAAALLLTCQRRAGRWKAELQDWPGSLEKALPASGGY